MISASSAYLTANANPIKKPIFVITISGYTKAFSNAPPTDSSSTPIIRDITEISALGGVVTVIGAGSAPPAAISANIWIAGTGISDGGPFAVTSSVENAPGEWTITFNNPLALGPGNATTTTEAITTTGLQFVTVAAVAGLEGGIVVTVDTGANQEVLMVVTVGDPDFKAIFTKTHLSGVPVTWNENIGSSGILTVTVSPIYDWLVGMEDHQVTVNDLDGGCDLSDFIFTVQDGSPLLPGAITADFPTFTFEGKTAQLLQGFAGMALADYVTLLTFRIESVESVTSNLEYTFSCPDILADLSQTIYATGDDGFATSSSHIRTLLGHPLDILIAALETECGYFSAQVDETKIFAYRDTIYSGALMKFTLDAAPTAKDFIESEIMKPLGMYLRTNNLGQITIESFYPLDTTTVMDFNTSNLFAIPMVGQADLINEVALRMDADSSSSFATEVVEDYEASITKYGLYGQQTIEAKGLRSGLNGIFLGAITAFLIFLRYGMKALTCGDNGKNVSSDPIDAAWSTALVEPGDFVTLTHPQVPDRDLGVIGITGKTFVVMDRTWQFFEGHVQYKIVEVDLSKLTEFEITSDGEADYTSASSGDKQTLMFLCSDTDQYSNGDPANTLS